jgi:undecaprenyl-diphosphatase
VTFVGLAPNPFDLRLFDTVRGVNPDGALTTLMVVFTVLGSGWTMFALLPLAAWRQARPPTVALGAVWAATAAVVFVVKQVVRRARPYELLGVRALWGRTPTDYSFPSGHAAGAFAFAGFVTTLCLADSTTRYEAWRWALSGGALLLATGIALSRVYLGVHFPTDVIGGAMVGGVLGVAGARVYRRRA